MSLARSFVSLALILPALLFACGTKEKAAPAAGATAAAAEKAGKGAPGQAEAELDFSGAPTHIAKLIPPNTAIYVQLQSLAQCEALLTRLARAHSSIGRQLDELRRGLHHMIPGDERHVVPHQPIGIAVTFPQDGAPEFTFVLPLRDVVSYKRSLQISARMPQPVFDGSYLAVTNSPSYERPREPVALAVDLPDRPISARIDLTRLDRRYGSQVRLVLAALASESPEAKAAFPLDPQLTAWFQEVSDPLLYAMAVGRQLDISVAIGDDRLQLDCAVDTREAGILAGWTATDAVDLTPFARSLVASDTIALLGGCDPSVLADRLARLLSDSEADRERMAGLLESFASQFGSIAAVSGSLSAGESHFALHVRASDDPAFARNLASTLELFSRSALGVAVQSKQVTTFEGVEVEDLVVHFDAVSMCALSGERADDLPAIQTRLDGVARSLFGADSVRVRITSFDQRGLIAIGNDDAWYRRTLLWAKEDKDLTPPDVRAALEHLGTARAAAVLRLDLARWTQDREDWGAQWSALSGPVAKLKQPGEASMHALDPQSLTLHLGAEGRTLRIGLSMGLPIEPSETMAQR
ncbi:MAG TPA: hypothetical protein VK843_20500 [Planctomycetota bacterium]|nr:hypothetical protein [Planctomycetota bacterium]